jgi:pSer/pThr/pTyr-binding forkhead associated (FHA) protein
MSGSPHQLKVGRSTGCELRIDDASVSGVHARLVVDNGRLRIFDAGSANGVFVNGARVNDAWIAWGDHVLLGRAPLPWNHPSLAPFAYAAPS